MDLSTIFAVAAAGVAGLTALCTMVYTVGQKTEALLTRFGEYVGTEKTPGLHVKSPLTSIARRVSTALQATTKQLEIKTSDDLFPQLPITVQWEVNDSKKFFFDNNGSIDQAMQLIEQSVRAHISGKTFQELYSGDRNAISNGVIADIAEHVSDYGMIVRRVVIDQPEASAEVKAKYEQVRTSAMEALAAKNRGEATIIQETAKAEGEKQRDYLRGDGAAGYRKRIFEQYADQIKSLEAAGISSEAATKMMLEIMKLDTYREIADKGNMVLIVPDAETGRSVSDTQTALRVANAANKGNPAGPTLH